MWSGAGGVTHAMNTNGIFSRVKCERGAVRAEGNAVKSFAAHSGEARCFSQRPHVPEVHATLVPGRKCRAVGAEGNADDPPHVPLQRCNAFHISRAP